MINVKKILCLLCVFIFLTLSIKTNDEVIIPDESIRIRVIANSNNSYDQMIKKLVSNHIEEKIANLLIDVENIDDARSVIKDNLLDIESSVANILEKNNYNYSYKVNFGYNLFPSKTYKGVTYNEGYYESIVVTIGEGKGENWWCVLFPPLCLMESNDNNMEEIEYKSFIKEIIDKYF